ncbi:MAG: hypothetical protein MJ179_00875 [Treponema sp.]|nr:hypothetical protein [Treponema sp.]
MEEIIIKNEEEYWDEKEYAESIYSPLISKFYMFRYQLRRFLGDSRDNARQKSIKDIEEVAEYISEEKKRHKED